MSNLIVAVVLIVIIGAAIVYIVKQKKNGTKCIGCPAGGNCSNKNGGTSGCSCGGQSNTNEKN